MPGKAEETRSSLFHITPGKRKKLSLSYISTVELSIGKYGNKVKSEGLRPR